jgi:hypothetical protein
MMLASQNDSEVMKSTVFYGYKADLCLMPCSGLYLNRRYRNPALKQLYAGYQR